MHHEPLILFDGICNLCSASVRFVIRRDPEKQFRFASLQSPLGVRLTRQHGCPELDSILLISEGRAFMRSTAALTVLRMIGGPWALMYAFIIVPPFLRDRIYDFIGQRRYRWFGKNDQCWLPDGDIGDRFVDDT